MEDAIRLDENIGYIYSVNHKSLIYNSISRQYMLDNANIIREYHHGLLNLYRKATVHERKYQFVELNPQIIEDATCITSQVIFEVTEKCNLSCVYCGYGDNYVKNYEKRSQHMDWKTAKTVLDYYIQIWKKNRPKKFKRYCYIGFYGGEPLLNMPLIKKIINYLEIHSEDLNFRYSMTTNGTLLQNNINYLIEKNFVLAVSFDGDKEMNSYRVYKNGKSIYDDLFTNLKDIKEKFPEYFKENIEFISVATSRNTDDGVTSFFKKEFDKTPQINELLSEQVADYERWDLIRRKKTTEDKNYNKILLSQYFENFSGNFYKSYKDLLDDHSDIIKTPTGTCLPFSLRTFVTVKNDIIACERIGFDHIIGKVTDYGVQIDFTSIANLYNRVFKKFKAQCEKCLLNGACNVCIFTNKNYFNESFRCEDFYSIGQLKESISQILLSLRNDSEDIAKLTNNVL